jgi:hypothetical protein
MDKNLKYAFLIPIGNSISGKLIPQLLQLHNLAKRVGARIYTIPNRIHVDARNALATKGGGFVNPTKLIKDTEWLVWFDADQAYTMSNVKRLLEYDEEEKFISGWYISVTCSICDWGKC